MDIARRITKATSVLLVAFASVAFAPEISHAAWPITPANRCWTTVGVPGSLLRIRIAPFGSDTYLLAGRSLSNGVLVNVLSGSAIVSGGDAIMNLHATGSDAGDFSVNILKCRVSKRTLAGSCEGFGFDNTNFVSGGPVNMEQYSVQITPVGCR